MATMPLDLQGLLGELPGGTEPTQPRSAADWEFDDAGVPAATRIGHVHLKVSELPPSEVFYSGVLGFEVMQRSYPGALFVAAGGYHHHIGLNTWLSAGGPTPPAGAVGLRSFELRLPDDASLRGAVARIESAGIAAEHLDDGLLVRDPSGNGVLLTA